MHKSFLGFAAGAILAGALTVNAQPTGTQWDCVLSGGGQEGVAFITFGEDGTFSGYAVLSSRVRKAAKIDPRGLFVDVGRSVEVNTNKTASTNLFGFFKMQGPWAYDTKGKVLGHFTQLVGHNAEGQPLYTNGVSFTAKVVPGKRLTMVASVPGSKVTYSGVPYKATPDFSGRWNGFKTDKRQTFIEFFELASATTGNPFGDKYADMENFPGIYYSLDGEGPGYTTRGVTLASSRKKIGFAFQSKAWGETNEVLNASVGSWSSSKGTLKASAVGAQEPWTPITFKASKAPAP